MEYLAASPCEQAIMLALVDPITDLRELIVNRGMAPLVPGATEA